MTTTRDIVIYAGKAFALSLPYAGTPGRGQRTHIRTADATATVVQILTHNGDANARVIYNDSTQTLDYTIGASVSALWLVGTNRVEWVFDTEDYDLSDVDDVDIPFRGKAIVYGNRTRAEDVTPSDQMPSGDGRYVRFDTDAQGLSDAQKLAARTNIGAGTGGGGGSGDVVGPASATDDRIAAFDSTTGKLIKQGSVTATAVASHLGSTGNPHSVTAAQVGADATGTAAGAVSTHNAVTTAHGISAFGAALVDDATAGDARTTLGLGGAAVLSVGTTAGTVAAGDDARLSDDRTASGLRSASTVVAVSSATAPTSGQVLTATSSTAATWQTPSSGSGDVVGPASSTDNAVVRFDSTTGKLLQNTSNVTIADTGAVSITPDANATALTVTSHTHTASAPAIDIEQTWNDAAVAFTGVKVNVTNTASAATSKVLDVRVGGTSQVYIGPTGNIHLVEDDVYLARPTANTLAIYAGSAAVPSAQFRTLGIATTPAAYIGWLGSSSGAGSFNTGFYLDAASIVALRSGTNAQTFRVYGTYNDAGNYVRASLAATSTAVTLTAETAGTGADNAPVILTPAGTSQVEVGNGVQFTEMTAPSAPAANKVILFAQDNGAGKTQLMALFPSGASQQVAIEP